MPRRVHPPIPSPARSPSINATQRSWGKRDVDIFDVDLERYIAAVRGRLRLLPPGEAAPGV